MFKIIMALLPTTCNSPCKLSLFYSPLSCSVHSHVYCECPITTPSC